MYNEPWTKKAMRYWPVVIGALSLTVTAASANTRLNDLADKVNYIWNNGAPPVAMSLARIDERQTQMSKTLDRVEKKLDDIDTRQQNGR